MAHKHPATSADQKFLHGRYQLLRTIGEGNYAKVKLAEHLPTGTKVAVKIVKLNGAASRYRFLVREIRCMKALQHANIVQLYEVIETKDTILTVMEYVSGGSVMDYLTSRGHIKEKEARPIFQKLLSAVYYCHQRGFVHSDIKPENILFDSKMNPKIADFGFSREYGDRKLNTRCCTPSYAAPEVFFGEDYEGPAADVWSFGVTLYRMVAGHLPFKAQDWSKLGQQLAEGKYTVPYCFSFKLRTFLKKMLTVKPEDRRDVIDIMSDPWIRQDAGEDLMMYSDPPNESADPWVEREMTELGFCSADIQDALTKKDFNNITAAYRILKAKHQFRCRIIHVKPYNSTDQSPAPAQEVQPSCSSSQQTEQHDDDYELGQEGKKPAAPAARWQLWTAAPGPSVEARSITPGSSTESRTITLRSTQKPRTIPPEPSPEIRPISHRVRPSWRSRASIPRLHSSSSEDSLEDYIPSTTSSSRSGSSGVTHHRWWRLARSCCSCFTTLCLRLPKNRPSRRNKVKPF